MYRKKIRSRLMAVILSAAVLSGCAGNTQQQTDVAAQNTAVEASFIVTKDLIVYDNEDYYTDWISENPSYIELKGNSASINGTGAAIKGSQITITSAGVYTVSGKLDDGQIIVDAGDKDTVKLVLNGSEINSSDNSPIYVKNAGKTIISLVAGTQNTIADGQKYELDDASSGEPNAAIFSKSDLTINGTGSLTVRGSYNNGIAGKDDLRITGGNISIYAKDDGLIGKDMLIVNEGNIKIEAGGDGLRTTNDAEVSKGYIVLQGGTFDIKSGTDGIQAATSLLIEGGKYAVVTGGGSAKAPQRSMEERPNPNSQQNNNTTTNASETESQSAKGIKASSDITITGGIFNLDTLDDAIHSNNSINVAAGDFSITAGDDGIHADSVITVKDGKINIAKSYEGIESALITIGGGDTHVVSSDDGINVGGGADGSSINGRPGQNNFSSAGNGKLNINGGYISVDSIGDGLDANGSIYMAGGTVVVSGPTSSGNGALDYDGEFVVSGGTLVSAGSSGMAQAPSDSSTQYSLAMIFSTTQQEETMIALKDNKGNTIAAFAPAKQYEAVVISSPELKKGVEYSIYSGGSSTGSLSDGFYKGGTYKDGTKIVSFTAEKSVTWLNESGVTEARSGHMGGPGGKGNPGSWGAPRQKPKQ